MNPLLEQCISETGESLQGNEKPMQLEKEPNGNKLVIELFQINCRLLHGEVKP